LGINLNNISHNYLSLSVLLEIDNHNYITQIE